VTFKEVRLSPKIGVGDFDTKVNRAVEFLEDGDRIKVTVRFRGRELTHPELGRNLIARFADRVKDHGIPERTPLLEGKSMHITMASTHKPKVHEGPVRAGDGADTREGAAAPTSAPAAATAPAPTAAAAPAPEAAPPLDTTTAAPAPKAPAAKAPAATETRTATRATAQSEPKTTNDKTPAPEPVRTGE